MESDRHAEMSAEAMDTFLGGHGTGVLSLAGSDEPYAIPISYGYDPSARRFYMRLVSTPDGEKRAFLHADPEARLVVYNGDGGTYRSVIATGTLASIDPAELDVEAIEQYGDAKRPLFELWPETKGDLDIELYRLDPETITGRTVTVPRD